MDIIREIVYFFFQFEMSIRKLIDIIEYEWKLSIQTNFKVKSTHLKEKHCSNFSIEEIFKYWISVALFKHRCCSGSSSQETSGRQPLYFPANFLWMAPFVAPLVTKLLPETIYCSVCYHRSNYTLSSWG